MLFLLVENVPSPKDQFQVVGDPIEVSLNKIDDGYVEFPAVLVNMVCDTFTHVVCVLILKLVEVDAFN